MAHAIDTTGSYPIVKMYVILKDEAEVDKTLMSAIQNLVLMKIVKLGDQSFFPKKAMTRGEAAIWLYNAVKFVKDHANTPPVKEAVDVKTDAVNADVNKMTLSRPEKNTAGYGIAIRSITFKDDGTAEIAYSLTDPKPGGMQAQVITTPWASTYVSSAYKPAAVQVLDEPTNHLDIDSREALEEALEEYTGTVLAISHDRYFINRIARCVWELRDGAISPFIGGYDDYKAKSKEIRDNAAAQQTAVPANPPAAAGGRAAANARASLGTHAAVKAEAAAEARRAVRANKPAGVQAEPQADLLQRRKSGEDKRREQLEQRIAELERSIGDLNDMMEQQEAHEHADTLASCWQEREALQQRLNVLYEEWMELAEE